jgi:hypothetical protein
MTSPRLIFESTAHFLQSEIQFVFRSFRKSAMNPNLYAIISPRGEKCGLAVYRFLALLLVLAISPLYVLARGGISDQPADQSLLVQIAMIVEDSPLPMRRDFAWLAMSEMASMYTGEANRARLETRHTARAHDTARWAASVDDYAARIKATADSITSATPIEIHIGADRSINLYVNGEPVIVTGVFTGQQGDYEQRIIEQFCVLYLCEQLLAEFQLPAPETTVITRKRTSNAAYWSFSEYAGPVCMTDDGLEFQFREMSGIREKRAVCSQVVAELYDLAYVLERKHNQGIMVDWGALEINRIAGSGGHRVVLNTSDDIRLPLPGLAASKDLFRIVRPWLAARAKGQEFHLVVLNAGHLMQGVGEYP